MNPIARQLKTGFILFGIAALLGTYLRAYSLLPEWATYKFILHTHSHIALIGWIYLVLSGLIADRYSDFPNSKTYRIIYRLTLISILGMMLSFPLQGYALWSIAFSTLFLILSYFFVYWISRAKNAFAKKSLSFKFIRSACFYLVLSSIGPWALGLIMALDAKDSIWYQLSVYFYLHFQYNGWMIFGLFGLLYSVLEIRGITLVKARINKTYLLLHLGVLLSFFSNVLWTYPPLYMHLFTALGGLILWLSLWNPYQEISKLFHQFQFTEKLLIRFIGLLLVIKSLSLIVLGFPPISKSLHHHKDLIIAFIHMNFIGIVSLLLFWLTYKFGYLKLSKTWIAVFITGFISTEIVLLIRSFQLSSMDFNFYLSLGSFTITIAIIGLVFKLKPKQKEKVASQH